jgi:hypothetical protein
MDNTFNSEPPHQPPASSQIDAVASNPERFDDNLMQGLIRLIAAVICLTLNILELFLRIMALAVSLVTQMVPVSTSGTRLGHAVEQPGPNRPVLPWRVGLTDTGTLLAEHLRVQHTPSTPRLGEPRVIEPASPPSHPSSPEQSQASLPPPYLYPQEELHSLALRELTSGPDEDELVETYGTDLPPTIQECEGSHSWILEGQHLNAPVPDCFLSLESIATRTIPIFDPPSQSQTWFMVARGIRTGVFDNWFVI